MSARATLEGGLFLTFLAPSLRQSSSAQGSTRRLSSLATSSTPLKSSRGNAGSNGGNGKQSQRSLSGLAQGQRVREETAGEPYVPVASTSAVRLDSPPSYPPFPPHSTHSPDDRLSTKLRRSPSHIPPILEPTPQPQTIEDVLLHLRDLHKTLPNASPLELVQRLQYRTSGSDASSSPTPPPLIRLDPQPHSHERRLLTPFLLQALFLGASALGLLARRKVRPAASEVRTKEGGRGRLAREEAENRVDELQALNLLVGAFTIPPEEGAATEKRAWDWKKGSLQPLLELVKTITTQALPVNRVTVASVLQFIASPPPSFASTSDTQVQHYVLARPVLASWAWEAYNALPPSDTPLLPSPSAPSPSFDSTIIHSLLSLVYSDTSREPLPHLRRIDQSGRSISADRDLLNSISQKVLEDPSAASEELLEALAAAAIRACRLDILEGLLERGPPLSATLRLDLASKALDLLARSGEEGRRNTAQVLARVADIEVAVLALQEVGHSEVDRIHGTLRRLQRAFPATGVAFNNRIASVILFLLDTAPEKTVQHPRLLLDNLQYLVRSRTPRAARRIFDAIPPLHHRLEHFEALLSSSHFPLSTFAWEALLVHPTLTPRTESFAAYLSSHTNPKAPSSSLASVHRAIYLMNTLGLPKTPEIHSLLLRILVRHASDPTLRRTLARMEREQLKQDEQSFAILASREMVRQDTQKRTVVVTGELGVQEARIIERARRSGMRTQAKKVAKAVQEAREKLAASAGGDVETPLLENLLAKSLSRLPREVKTVQLVELIKAQLGVDLSPLLPSSPSSPPSSIAPTASSSPPPLLRLPTLSASNLTFHHFKTSREPKYRLFATGLEKRGAPELARALSKALKVEEGLVRHRLKRRKEERRKKGEEGEGHSRGDGSGAVQEE